VVGAGRGGAHIAVHNPFTGAAGGHGAQGHAGRGARRPSRSAKRLPAKLSRFERSQHPEQGGRLAVRSRTAEIAALITAESGLCLKDSTYEAGRVADVLMFGANEC
jgi:acyl-CoA reductase-like NAD-dependent aldehyde dehydrogenase